MKGSDARRAIQAGNARCGAWLVCPVDPRVRASSDRHPPNRSLQARSFSLQGWGLIDLPLRATFSPAHPLARRDVPLAQARAFRDRALHEYRRSSASIPSVPGAHDQRGCPFQFFTFFRGSRQSGLHCAHRTSTFRLCAFCEQEGRLPAPSPIFRL